MMSILEIILATKTMTIYLQENIFHVIKSHKHWNDKTENSQKVKDHQVGLDNKICTLVRTISSDRRQWHISIHHI